MEEKSAVAEYFKQAAMQVTAGGSAGNNKIIRISIKKRAHEKYNRSLFFRFDT